MKIKEVIEKMTSVIGKAEPFFTDSIEQFKTELAVCREDLINTTAQLTLPNISRYLITFPKAYIDLFLDKFGKVDAMIDKLLGDTSTEKECCINEETFKGIDLKDIGIENVQQAASELELWNYRTGVINPDVVGKVVRFNIMSSTLDGQCCGDEYGVAFMDAYSERGLKIDTNSGKVYCAQSTASRMTGGNALGMRVRCFRDQVTAQVYVGSTSYVGDLSMVEPSTTRLYQITDTDQSSLSRNLKFDACKFTLRESIYVKNPLSPTLSLGEGSDTPPLPPNTNAGEPEIWTITGIKRIFIEYSNKNNTVLNFDNLFAGNFGGIATNKGLNGLLVKYLDQFKDTARTATAQQAEMLINEAKELGEASITWSNVKHPRQMEMLASLFAVKFALIKILYGHVRRIKLGKGLEDNDGDDSFDLD